MAAARSSCRRSDRSEQIFTENLFGLRHRLNGEESLAQLRRARQPFRVPAEVLAELEGGLARVALQPQRQPRMLECRAETFGRRRIGALGTAFEQVMRL